MYRSENAKHGDNKHLQKQQRVKSHTHKRGI